MLIYDKKILEKFDSILRLNESYQGRLINAVEEYISLKNRSSHPVGIFDKAGRWEPKNPCSCCEKIRSPSRRYPLSLNKHCRSPEHVANVYGVSKSDLTKAYNIINKYIELNGDIKTVYLLSKIVNDALSENISNDHDFDYDMEYLSF